MKIVQQLLDEFWAGTKLAFVVWVIKCYWPFFLSSRMKPYSECICMHSMTIQCEDREREYWGVVEIVTKSVKHCRRIYCKNNNMKMIKRFCWHDQNINRHKWVVVECFFSNQGIGTFSNLLFSHHFSTMQSKG